MLSTAKAREQSARAAWLRHEEPLKNAPGLRPVGALLFLPFIAPPCTPAILKRYG